MNDPFPRIPVLGAGGCTPLGTTWKQTRAALSAGQDAVRPFKLFDRETAIARVSLDEQTDVPRFHQLATRALEDLLRSIPDLSTDPLGVVCATSKGGQGRYDISAVVGPGNPGEWAGRVVSCFPGVRRFSALTTACASGLSGLIQACRWIADGEVDHAVVVASESSFYPLTMAGYMNLKVLCGPAGMRPFHPERDGFALGEAAAAVYLGKPDRSSGCLGWIRGWSETCDARHVTRHNPQGTQLRRALNQAVDRAGLTPDRLDLLYPHLTTTQPNDRLEHDVLSEWPGDPAWQGMKPAIGHTVAAGGLLEAIATCDHLRSGELFPVAGLEPEHAPRPVRPGGWPRGSRPRFGLTWNMGFGGHNVAAVIEASGDDL